MTLRLADARQLPVLSSAALNRATLARQLLLERADLDVVRAIEAVGGLQAQEPASPFIALWTRLAGFAEGDLADAFTARAVVKATLMRVTLHAVSAADHARLLPALRPMHHAIRRRGASTVDEGVIAGLGRSARDHAREPRTNVELRAHVDAQARAAGVDLEAAWWWVRLRHDFIHVPTTRPWSFARRPTLSAAEAWLVDEPFATEADGIAHLVHRYLGAFGPATLADAGAWSGIATSRLRPGLAALEDAGALWHGQDERGRRLVDLVDAPRPDGAVAAPPRFLAMWDSILLAHQDRTRIMDDATRALVIARNGDTLPTFLVDGRVAGLWWPGDDGGRCRIELEPFTPLAAGVRRELETEAERLAAFLEPLEPTVYRRYRSSLARRRPT